MGIADHRYVSLTTFRRTGEGVATPVWLAPMGDGRAGFTTAGDSGKVKRIRNGARVTLRPCDVRGRVPDGAEQVTGRAEVVVGGEVFHEVERAMKAAYGWQFAITHTGSRLKHLVRLGPPADCAVVIALDE